MDRPIFKWERGGSYPDIAMIPLISEVLRTSADELLSITLSCESRENLGELRIRADEPQMHGIKPSDPDPILRQSQIDSIFDYTDPLTGENKKVLVVDDSDL